MLPREGGFKNIEAQQKERRGSERARVSAEERSGCSWLGRCVWWPRGKTRPVTGPSTTLTVFASAATKVDCNVREHKSSCSANTPTRPRAPRPRPWIDHHRPRALAGPWTPIPPHCLNLTLQIWPALGAMIETALPARAWKSNAAVSGAGKLCGRWKRFLGATLVCSFKEFPLWQYLSKIMKWYLQIKVLTNDT